MHSKLNNDNSEYDEDSDKKLILMLADGCETALNKLMQRYKHKLFFFIFKYVQNEDVAYDILQETFIRVYTKANTYKPQFAVSTWIYQISMNLCRDWGRKQKVKQFISLDTFFSPDSTNSLLEKIEDPLSDTENLVSHRNQLEFIEKEIQKLPHKLKTALILFAIEGHSQEKCAEILNVTPKTVEMRVYRARKILLEKIPEIF